jgi:hypothetical protein
MDLNYVLIWIVSIWSVLLIVRTTRVSVRYNHQHRHRLQSSLP